MVPKETGTRLFLVNPTIPARVNARSRADQRLQSMTMGAAVIGIAATGVFGYAAALTYTGKTSTANAANPPVVQNTQPRHEGGGDDGFGGSQFGTSGESNEGGAIVNPFFGGQQVNPPTITGGGHSHSSSGGS